MNHFTRQARILANIILIGTYFSQKYRLQAAENGVFKAAKNLRKQGVSAEVAVSLLARG